MAAFCAKCGSSLPPDVVACPACGAAVEAVAAPVAAGFAPVATPVSAPPSYPPPVAQPVYAAPPPAKSSGGGWVKILLIVVAVFVLLGVSVVGIFIYGIYRVKQAVKVDEKGNATISGMGGFSASAGKDVNITEAHLGVPIYPGSTKGQGGAKIHLPNVSIDSAVLLTDDPPSSVVAFYKGKLGDNEMDTETGNGTILNSARDSGAGGKNGTTITVSPGTGNNSGKTQITIVHTVATK